MASGDTLLVFTALQNEPTELLYATLDMRNAHPVLDFDASINEAVVFAGVLPRNYSGGGLTVCLHWTCSSGEGVVSWRAGIENLSEQDLDVDSFAAYITIRPTAPANGILTEDEIVLSDGIGIDSLQAGQPFRIKIFRSAAEEQDTLPADAELRLIEIKET